MKRPPTIPVLHGSYAQPALRRGDRTYCLVRDCLLVVTSWSDAPISWPRGCRLPKRCRGFPSLIVDEELARAIQHESAAAIIYWWGVSKFTVIKWRKALDATRKNNAGSQILIHAATAKARDVANQHGPTEEYRRKQRNHMIRRRLWELAPAVTHGIPWMPEHLALLGTMTDDEVVARTGHPFTSVRTKRQKLRIPAYRATR